MRKVAIPLAILALIGLDQWVKHWVVANIALNQVIKAIPGLFSLTYLQNRGAAFSILQNQKYSDLFCTVFGTVFICIWFIDNQWINSIYIACGGIFIC